MTIIPCCGNTIYMQYSVRSTAQLLCCVIFICSCPTTNIKVNLTKIYSFCVILYVNHLHRFLGHIRGLATAPRGPAYSWASPPLQTLRSRRWRAYLPSFWTAADRKRDGKRVNTRLMEMNLRLFEWPFWGLSALSWWTVHCKTCL